MSKYNEKQKDNLELERNINSYLKKKIEGAAKHYKKDYFERKKFETSFDDINQAATENQDIMQNLFKSELSKEDILFAEQFFDNYELFKAYQRLSEK